MIARSNYAEFNTPQYRRLSDDQMRRLHHASLEILDRTGVCLYDADAVDLARKAGARISDGNRVRIPPRLIEWALSVAPKHITICDRHGRRVMPLERGNVFFGPGSDCQWVLDHRTGERLLGSMEFVRQGIRVCDALPNIDFVMSLCQPAEVEDQALAGVYQMRAMLENTTKPIIFVTLGLPETVAATEMAEAVVGGEDALRARPLCINYINYAHALRHNEEALQRLFYSASKGLPCIYSSMLSAGATGPMTAAGSIALGNAGDLVGILLAQLVNEGAPVIMSSAYVYVFEMSAAGAPPFAPPRTWGSRPEMCRYYGLPAFGLGGAGHGHAIDVQAGIELALTLLGEAMSGADIVHDVGYLSHAALYSLQMLVIGDEMIDFVKHFLQGVPVNEETLALDLIDEVGPHGHYMAKDHTLAHFREEWHPQLFETHSYERWAAAGGKSMAQRAAERVDRVLAQHRPEPLPADIQQKLAEIADGARRRSQVAGYTL